jgi:hypothetical protein
MPISATAQSAIPAEGFTSAELCDYTGDQQRDRLRSTQSAEVVILKRLVNW